MARRKADRSTERGERRAETAAVAAYLTALRAQLPARSRDALEKRRAQVEQWIAEESSPIREVELIQQRLDIDAQLAQIDQAARLPELEEAFVNMAASWAKRSGITAARCARSACPLACLQGLASEPGRNQDAALASRPATNVFVAVVSNWRDGFKFAWQQPDPEPEGPGLVWRETGPDFWSGSWHSQPRGTVMLESSGRWVAYLRLEDPPGLSPIATVGRFATVDEAMVATDEVWAARGPS